LGVVTRRPVAIPAAGKQEEQPSMGDKRRYVSKHPSPRRDVRTAEHGSGNPIVDGYSTRYSNPLPGREDGYRAKDSLYNERFQCDGLMDDSEARWRTPGEDT
jgi:hypothetical protein